MDEELCLTKRNDSSPEDSYNTISEGKQEARSRIATHSHTRCCTRSRRFLRVLFWVQGLTVLFFLSGVIAINAWFTYDHRPRNEAVDPQYSLLPCNSSYQMPVHPDRYGAMVYSFTRSTGGSPQNVKLILRSVDDSSTSPFIFSKSSIECELDSKKALQQPDCYLTRYWPTQYPSPTGNLSCRSNLRKENKETYIVWKWTSFVDYHGNSDLSFHIDCPHDLSKYHRCGHRTFTTLTVDTILKTRHSTKDIVTMRVCYEFEPDSVDALIYKVDFTEYQHRPVWSISHPYNEYQMGSSAGVNNVTVPLTAQDHHVRIVVDGDTEPIEIKQVGIPNAVNAVSSVRRSDQKERHRVFIGSIVAVVSIFVVLCVLAGMVVCSCKCKNKKNPTKNETES